MFSEAQMNEFIELYEKEFGSPISRKQADVYASQFINLLLAVYQSRKATENDPPP